jgi:RimJ/RimL family protein N-acetyltransferase
MEFSTIRTDRLVIRAFETEDAEGLWLRRNDAEVARYQNWTTPFARERVDQMVSDVIAAGGPAPEEWWMAAVCLDGEVIGDLALHLTWEGRSAEVGYTFASGHWGNGYATEALEALVGWLFTDAGITRAFGMLHPDNRASAMVLERTGFLFEGHTRLSFWLDDEVSDDWLYGMTRGDWSVWRSRPRTKPSTVRLVEVGLDNVESVAALRTHKSQEDFVAPMADSFRHAMFPEIVQGAPVVPWMRAIDADGTIVGFVMLALTTDHHPEPFMWRLLIDRVHQRRGVGAMALDLVADECRAMGDSTLLTSWTEGKGSPRPFYLAHGFEPTGEELDHETLARKQL